jgi:BirA family transcriptional regulator, biotin operon repressor / biotin---[acetyl-CoA-carboxylase] ligase
MQRSVPLQVEPLHLDYIKGKLQGSAIGQVLSYHVHLPTTMNFARHLVQESISPKTCSGTMIVAEEQTAGRGRLQRRWESPAGRSLLTSTIVAAPHLPAESMQMPMIVGLAILDALRHVTPVLARQLWLKWPNDLIVVGDGAVGKLAGTLIESAFGSQGISYSILGIGINVNQRASELPAAREGGLRPASLYTLLKREVSREDLLVALCWALNRLLASEDKPGPIDIHQRWQAALINLGRQVTVRASGDVDAIIAEGRVVGTTRTGSLIIEQNNGLQQIIEAGDVELRWHAIG